MVISIDTVKCSGWIFLQALLCMVRAKVLVVLNNKLLCCSANKLGASSPRYLHSVVLFILCSKSMDVSASIPGIWQRRQVEALLPRFPFQTSYLEPNQTSPQTLECRLCTSESLLCTNKSWFAICTFVKSFVYLYIHLMLEKQIHFPSPCVAKHVVVPIATWHPLLRDGLY